MIIITEDFKALIFHIQKCVMNKKQYRTHKYYYDIYVKVLNKTQSKSRTPESKIAKIIVSR